jgi:hypothetical protein
MTQHRERYAVSTGIHTYRRFEGIPSPSGSGNPPWTDAPRSSQLREVFTKDVTLQRHSLQNATMGHLC